MDFEHAYRDGGLFMHVITVLGAITTGALLRGVVERRIATARRVVPPAPGTMVPRLCLVILLAGVLALVDGGMQTMAALNTISMDQWPAAFARATAIVLIPFGWALSIATTILFADTMLVRRRAPSYHDVGIARDVD